MLRTSGRRIDLSTPFVDAMLPDGSRLHVVIPQITREHMAVNIRKFVLGLHSLDELMAAGSLTEQAARFLEGSGEIPLRRLVKEALRMRPQRLIVGEVRQGECLDLLIALNSGLPGMCTLHANSAREALVKMCTLPLLAGENVSAAFVVPTVAASVDLVVHLGSDASGHRRVSEIVAVPGRVEGDVIETSDIFVSRGGRLERADGYPPHPERFEAAGIDLISALGHRADRGTHRIGPHAV